MSITEPGLPGETLAGDEAAIGDAFGSEVVVELGTLDTVADSADLITETESFLSRVPQLAAGTSEAELSRLITALVGAETDGEVLPGQVSSSVAFVLKIAGVAALAGTSAAAAALQSAFSNYAVDAGNASSTAGLSQVQGVAGGRPFSNVVVAPVTGTVRTTSGAVTIAPPAVPNPTSPGGKLVAAAERTIKRTTINVPGLTPGEARGISAALAREYQNFLTVQVDVANDIESQLASTATEIKTLTDEVKNLHGSATDASSTLSSELKLIDTRIANLISGQSALQHELTGLQRQLAGVTTQPPVTSAPPAPVTGTELTPAELGLIATIPTLATVASVQHVQNELDNLPAPPPETQTSPTQLIPTQPPMTLQDLVDCCEANDAVTGPIREGGATPGLLSGLGKLLEYATVLGVVASIVTTLLGILDLDDSVAGFVWSAEHVATIVDRAIPAVTSELDWSDTFALGTG